MRYHHLILCAFLAVSPVVALQIAAKPTKAPPPAKQRPPKPWAPPDLRGVWNGYTITQSGQALEVQSKGDWRATGWIHEGGTVVIYWVRLTDGSLATGAYQLADTGRLDGKWGYGAAYNGAEIVGADHFDTMRRGD